LRFLVLLVVFFFLGFCVFSQESSAELILQLKLVEESSNLPVEFATLSVYSTQDSSLVTGGVSDKEGLIRLQLTQRGTFYGLINFIGFQPWTIENIDFSNTDFQDLGTIFLGSGSLNLDEVVVTERKSQMQMQLDKRVFNADANLTTRGADALQLLGEVPSVEVDADGQISLRGSSDVNVLIDGRPTGIPASQLLQSIPASQIDRIEIITNPSAKYEAEGMSGILNVILKKNSKGGFSSSLGTAYSMGIRPRLEANTAIAYRNKNFNAYVNYSYNFRNRYSIGAIDKEILLADSSFFLNNTSLRDRPNIAHNFKAGIEYTLNDRNLFYFSTTVTPSEREGFENTDYLNYNVNFQQVNGSSRIAMFDALDQSQSFNLGWNHTFTNKSKIDVDLFHNVSEQKDAQNYEEIFFNALGVAFGDPLLETFDFARGNEVTRLSADYTLNLPNGGKVETGYRYDRLFIDNEIYAEIYDADLGEFTSNVNINNRFVYNQDIHALYGTYAQKVGLFNFLFGIRYEGTRIGGDLIGSNFTFERSFNNFFPSASAMLSMGNGWDASLSYSKRVKRPSAGQLNPFTDYSDPYNLRSGNSLLNPEFMDALELGFLKIWSKLTLNASLFGNFTKNEINRFLYPNDQGITLSTYENVGESLRVGMEFFVNYYPVKWLKMNVSGNVRQNTFVKSNVELANVSTTSMSFNFMSNFSLPWGVNFQVSSRYRPGFATNQGKIYSFFNVDFALAKDFMDNKLSLTLQGNDLFNTLRFKYDLIQSNIVQQTLRDWDSRRMGIALSYKFGQDGRERSKRDFRRGDNNRRGSDEMDDF
jgi:outer membrane receptor protein involved in Fe transport